MYTANDLTVCDDILESGSIPSPAELEACGWISDPCPEERTAIRVLCGLDVSDRRPVYVISGDAPPAKRGKSYYHTTPSGKTIVHYPNAYGYRTMYHPSTLRIEVGAQWLAAWRRSGGVFLFI